MNINLEQKYSDDPRVIEARKQLENAISDCKRDEKEKAKTEREEYKKWYASLSEMERMDEDIRKIKENSKIRTKRLVEKKKKLELKTANDIKRDTRTHLLCQVAGELSSILKKEFGRDLEEGDEKIFAEFLYSQFQSGELIFPVYWKKAEEKLKNEAQTNE